jgi:hypothetical protein
LAIVLSLIGSIFVVNDNICAIITDNWDDVVDIDDLEIAEKLGSDHNSSIVLLNFQLFFDFLQRFVVNVVCIAQRAVV